MGDCFQNLQITIFGYFWGWRGGNSTSYDCDDHDQAAVTAVNAGVMAAFCIAF